MDTKPKIKLSYAVHRDNEVVKIVCQYSKVLNELLNKEPKAKWSKTMNCWYIFKNQFNLNLFFDLFKEIAFIDYSAMRKARPQYYEQLPNRQDKSHRIKIEMPDGYEQLLIQKRYSQSTIKSYVSYFKDFIYAFRDIELTDITSEEINNYIVDLIKRYNISNSQQNQHISAIKFYYEKVLMYDKLALTIERPFKERRLPVVISKQEIKSILENCGNLKHKCIISLIYSAGLRRSELINLCISDINSDNHLIRIRSAKGKKDRVSLLSEKLIVMLREYYKKYRPQYWLFEGQSKNLQYSATSIAKILTEACTKAKLRKHVTPHVLRHSFATHLLEQGTDIRYIQELLGHSSSKTTEIYTHVTNREFKRILNPLDEMFSELT